MISQTEKEEKESAQEADTLFVWRACRLRRHKRQSRRAVEEEVRQRGQFSNAMLAHAGQARKGKASAPARIAVAAH